MVSDKKVVNQPVSGNAGSFWQSIQEFCQINECSASCQQDDVAYYGDVTTGYTSKILGIFWPTTTKHVQFIVRLANEYGIPLYPISAGKNWGYSDAMPSKSHMVLIDLSKMNKIVEVDEENKLAIIEPGVTQRQLSDRLKNTSLFMDCTGAPEFTSIVGNILERGFGHTLTGNRQFNSCSFEVVLGNGEILRTGHLAYESSGAHGVRNCHTKPTTGPIVDGLFSQSNFGIVTKLCFWLMPRPESILPYIVIFNSHEDFLNAIEPLSALKQAGVARSVMHVGNDMRAISSSIAYNLIQPNADELLTRNQISESLANLGIGPWAMSGALYGSKKMVSAYKSELKRALNSACHCKIHFLPECLVKNAMFVANGLLPIFSSLNKLLPLQFVVNELAKLKANLISASALIDMHSGTPTNYFLKGCYHKHSSGFPTDFGPSIDIAKDGCGLIWMSPTAPTSKRHISEVLELLRDAYESEGFHLYATLSFIDDRSTAIICNPVFDVTNEEETRRAIECSKAAMVRCIRNGFPPYRVANVHWKAWHDELSQQHKNVLTALKQVFDPNGVLANGRYGIELD
ncbi:FAD-binding oxidoreductase [Thalassotalea euphylliae]|uniref:FAD-binding oxidoreductase n=1 Tax=Thalassotalea euphylliae TaxID=1655234 RepID=A0A3E0U3G7_9GAMM|nr:FAD-binding oxidoreductase [Thalassotalea euphylliae]REL31476.1 FAD-binding oxidoreductase [Thalassotalea euphylliae]